MSLLSRWHGRVISQHHDPKEEEEEETPGRHEHAGGAMGEPLN